MSETRDRVVRALADYDPALDREPLEEAERERAEVIGRFPRGAWPQLELADYAVGLQNPNTYCRRVEFSTPNLGSIKGGSSNKLLIFKRKTGDGWYYDEAAFTSVDAAWERVREDFVSAMDATGSGEWALIEDLNALKSGQALLVKTLHIYFPDRVLPIYSRAHLSHFLGLLDRDEAMDSAASAVALNRVLLAELHAIGGAECTPSELAYFLYRHFAPATSPRWVKISPGRQAIYWDEFREGAIMAVGWEEIGDLREFAGKEEFRVRYFETYDDPMHVRSRKANELWTMMELRPGDRIVANRGKSKILAVGTVREPLYEYRGERAHYKHVISVDWDTSYEKDIPQQGGWLNTIDKVTAAQRALIERGGAPDPDPPDVDERYAWYATALAAKKQVVLYGPPGTGKTFHARRFAAWWLRRPGALAGPDALRIAERDLGDQLTLTTFHPSYAYEDFVEGFRPVPGGAGTLSLQLEDGVFKRLCELARADPDRPYVLIIDEINRANVAKVFGELITLLEADKRGLEVTLPQSKQRFSVPPNVFLLGTMNTADRSITLMDVALRRRFAFVELMPEPEALEQAVGPLKLQDFLAGLNREVARVAGREKQIGHAFLMPDGVPVAAAADFARIFRLEILPLLQEYCYEEYGQLESILGPAVVDVDAQSFKADVLENPDELVQALATRFSASAAETGETP